MSRVALCPPTPAGLALGALLGLFGTEPDLDALAQVFDRSFLASCGVDELVTMFAEVGGATLVAAEAVGEREVHARVRAATGHVARLRVVVADAPPHRVAGLVVRPEQRPRAGPRAPGSGPLPGADRGGPASAPVPFGQLVPLPATIHLAGLAGADAGAVVADLVEAGRVKQITGLSVAVVERGRVAAHASCGWAALQPRLPVEARTVFRAYGITRLLTAVAVLQLWEEQQFDLDDPVNDHLRALRVEGPGRAITVRDLLSHRSGLGPVGADGQWRTRAAPAAEVLGPVIEAPDRPGPVVDSPAGYGVLAQLVEELTGRPFAEHVLAHVVEPLGMVSSDIRHSDPPGEQFATGHEVMLGEAAPAPTEVAALVGSGGLFTTAPDLAAFALAVIGGGANGAGRVLSPEAMALATSPAGRGGRVGLGFRIASFGRHRVVWHDGAGPGFSGVLAVAPDRGAAVALLANTAGCTGGPGGLEEEATTILREVIRGGR